MKARELKRLLVLMIVSVSLSGLACASNRVNLLKDGNIKLERVSSKSYYISHVGVYQNDDELEVHGNVKRRAHSSTEKGHVDIAIVSPDGENLKEISTNYTPRIIPARMIRKRKSYFHVSMPTIPPVGSIVRVAYHRDSKPDRESFSCEGNIALLDVGNL